jgi:hypothetical protein
MRTKLTHTFEESKRPLRIAFTLILLPLLVFSTISVSSTSSLAAGATVRQVAATSMYNCYYGYIPERLLEPSSWRVASFEMINGKYQVWTSTNHGPFFLAIKPSGRDKAFVTPLDKRSSAIWSKFRCPKNKSIKVWYNYVNKLFNR